MSKQRVVITGLGLVTSLGQEVDVFTENIKQGKLGLDFIESFDTSTFNVKVAGEIKQFDPTGVVDKKLMRRLDRHQQFALYAAKKAYEDANLTDYEIDRYQVGVLLSSGIGGLTTIQNEIIKMHERGHEWISPFFIPMSIGNLAAGHVSMALDAKGLSASIVTACAASGNAIGEAFHAIREGRQTIVIAGGTEASINKIGIGGFAAMKALNESHDPKRASIPFDKERSGFVMGEGAAVLILESLESAQSRNAKIYAEIVGYGATNDAYHMTSPSPDGIGAITAMKQAIELAGIKPSDVDYINAHGTSTVINDRTETTAIKQVFNHPVHVSSTKSMVGHLLGASGAVEALICVKGLQEGFMPPNINHQEFDEECDVNLVKTTKYGEYNYAMSNSLGFGGHNAVLLFKKWSDENVK